jgi:hypothetical protein
VGSTACSCSRQLQVGGDRRLKCKTPAQKAGALHFEEVVRSGRLVSYPTAALGIIPRGPHH